MGSRGIALHFHDHGTRRGWGVCVSPRPLFSLAKDPVSIVQAVWAPGPVWTGAEILIHTGIRSPDRPARSQSLYWLRYLAHMQITDDSIIRRMRFACWIKKCIFTPPHTHTHTLRICNSAFTLQQWLRERSSLLLCPYVECLVRSSSGCFPNNWLNARSEAVTAGLMCEMTPCRLVNDYRSFGGAFCLHL
jgi:hypothetical protein